VSESHSDISDSLGADLLVGAKAIAAFTGLPARKVYWFAETQKIPTGRLGSVLIASKKALREHFAQLTRGQ
jgi:hypothetical protein